jgi:hypothetical protein
MHGAGTIEMTVVNVRKSLISRYQRRGYRLTGKTRPFPYGDDRFGTPTRGDLEFVVLERHLREQDCRCSRSNCRVDALSMPASKRTVP